MPQYRRDSISIDIDFTPNDLIRVPFQSDGVSHHVLSGNLVIDPVAGVSLTVITRAGVMLLEQTDGGWKITERITAAPTPGIHIGGKVTGDNVNIGGIQNLGGKDKD